MKVINLFLNLILVLFVFKLELYADFVDLGSDPMKIEIVEMKDIAIGSDFEVLPWEFDFAKWSPDGIYFTIDTKRKEPLKTAIYSNGGVLLKSYDGRFLNWSLDSKKIVCVDYKTKRLFIYDVISGNKKELSNDPYIRGIYFHEDSNYLIGFCDVNYKGGAIQSIVYKIEINSGIKKELFITKRGNAIDSSNFQYFSDDKLFYPSRYEINSIEKINLCRLDLNTGKDKIIFTKNNSLHTEFFKVLNNEIRIMIDLDNGSKIIVDENGANQGILKDEESERLIKNKEYIKHGQTIVPMNLFIIPNNKLLIVGKGTEGLPDELAYIDEFINICDFPLV